VNPSTLFSAAPPSGPATARPPATAGQPPRDAARGAGSFDRHLQQDSPGKDATSAAAARRRAERPAADASKADTPAPGDTRQTQRRRDAAAESAPAQPSSPDSAGSAQTPDQDAQDAWPPLDLAGLALSPVTVPGVVAPAVASDPAAPGTSATGVAGGLPSLPTAAGLAPGVSPAVAAGAARPADTAPEALEDLPEALTFEAVLDTATEDAGDAPDPLASLLQPGALLPATRSVAEMAALRGTVPVDAPVLGQDGFDEAISARIGWLADQKIGHAHIRISPDDMGTIDVRLQMDGDRIHATFASPHVEVRQALESSLPRLRELLGEQGFQLAHADVGQQQGDGGSGPRNGGAQALGSHREGTSPLVETTVTAAQLIRQRGLLDTYA